MREISVGNYSRSVSIVGVGCTPWMKILDDPETVGLTEGELFGYAALEAMEDAGIEGDKVQAYFHGQAMPIFSSDYITANVHVADWCGLRGRASYHHSEACCTGYVALDLAVQSVASGKYDCVLTGAVDTGDTKFVAGQPAYERKRLEMQDFLPTVTYVFDRAYTRALEGPMYIGFDDVIANYSQKYGVSLDDLDDAMNMMAVNNRYNASKNELALHRTPFEDIAADAGFDDVHEYMKSAYNPKMSDLLRASGFEERCEGAAAVIVMPTDMARDLVGDRAVEVLGCGNSVMETRTPHWETLATQEAVRQAYEVTGVTPDEIDLMLVNDFIIASDLMAAEVAGYLPEGEGWKYIRDGRTRFDSDRPMNTGGGRTSFGHAHGASGLADVVEATRQLRGEAGEHQVASKPETALLRGFGGGQNVCVNILRASR